MLLRVEVVSNLFWNHHSNSNKSTFCFNECMVNALVVLLNESHGHAEVEIFPGCGEDLSLSLRSQLKRGAGLCLQPSPSVWAVSPGCVS